MHSPLNKTFKHITGATLLEVMVAMTIMALGLLGYAALEIAGLQNNQNAGSRTNITITVNDLIERMRANPAAVATGSYAAIDTALIDCAVPPLMCEDRVNPSVVCTADQMATFDAFTVSCANNQITAGAINISCTDSAGAAQACANTTFRTLSVNWQNQTENGAANKNLTYTFRP